ncbi:MAG: tyrosine-protein phosphatase [Oscillospiraceae bacterium]|nr:tyrosine-protein phosphatase [Oscillospiraceae bacterium]
MIKRFISSLLLVSVLCLLLVSCGGKKDEPSPDVPTLKEYGMEHEPEFGGIYITASIDYFNSLGFSYGDSVDLFFSNGYTMEDIPYYNGYYVDPGQPLLIAYPGYKYIKAAINFGDDLWDKAGILTESLKAEISAGDLWVTAGKVTGKELTENSSATVVLREKGKYLDIQNARDISYSDDRSKFPSDAVFANFRQFSMGSIAPARIYRSASPCDNQHNRASFVDAQIRQAGVNCILNLCDNDAKMKGYIEKDDFDSPYFLSLYSNGSIIPLALNANYTSDEFASKVADGFRKMTEAEGPYLVHCTEGKDRTGFVCMLIEALAGAGYREMADDYMITYDNYYKINKNSEPEKYSVILEKSFDTMLQFLAADPDADLEKTDFSVCARNYLLKAGMTESEIDSFILCLA